MKTRRRNKHMFPVRFKGTKNMCPSKNKGYKLLKVSLTKGTV